MGGGEGWRCVGVRVCRGRGDASVGLWVRVGGGGEVRVCGGWGRGEEWDGGEGCVCGGGG